MATLESLRAPRIDDLGGEALPYICGRQRGALDTRQEGERKALEEALHRQSYNLEARIRDAYERREREDWKELAANDSRPQQQKGPEPGSRERNGRWRASV